MTRQAGDISLMTYACFPSCPLPVPRCASPLPPSQLQDRNTNVARMGWVAAEVVRHGGIAICSTISPFDESREESRQYIEETGGGFILVHISTSVDECAARDVKGLYQKAKQNLITLTGVSHPYEFPDKAELTIDAGVVAVESSVDFIVGACRCWSLLP